MRSLKNGICALCSGELLNECETINLFKNATPKGTPYIDILREIVKIKINSDEWSDSVCNQCSELLLDVENKYHEYLKSIHDVSDVFEKSQNLLCLDSTQSVFQTAIKDDLFFLKKTNVSSKVLFNIHGASTDFNLDIKEIYKARSVLGIENNDVNNELSLARVNSDSMNEHRPIFYCSQEEFDLIQKFVVLGELHCEQSDLVRYIQICILGHKVAHKMFLSYGIGKLYKSAIQAKETNNYVCGDCSISFSDLHRLCNHVRSFHEIHSENKSNQIENKDKPTLDKPFQCKVCMKCFGDYLNLSTHVDHHHGYSRTCNVESCSVTSKSIQEFVLHYARHANSLINLPKDFEAKKNMLLSCPLCSIRVRGIWKYALHSHTHDADPRFACPVCFKGFHRVQNFKDHLKKHSNLN